MAKVDEPTLIVIPEAQALPDIAEFATVQTLALDQCETLQDRFVIMDVHGKDVSLSDRDTDLRAAVTNFRGPGLGTNLKYGAAYAPNLETILDYDYDESQTTVRHTVDGAARPQRQREARRSRGRQQRAVRARARARSVPGP